MFSMGQPNISAIAIWTHYMLRGHFLFRLGNVRDSRCCGTDRCLVGQVFLVQATRSSITLS